MKNYLIAIILLLLFAQSCNNPIKNEEARVEVEDGAAVPAVQPPPAPAAAPEEEVMLADEAALGYWVGYFNKAGDDYNDKTLIVDEGFIWSRRNKINISIDKLVGDSVWGHSVVAGNDRPFAGTRTRAPAGDSYVVREPGDDKYDGEFRFEVAEDGLIGTWTAYRDIEIKEREYSLERKAFVYDPTIMLEQSRGYVNWNKSIESKDVYDMGDGEMEEWIYKEFATSTYQIYELNASSDLLEKTEVENLKKGDLTIIRNTIYARHGYSFKNRPLRVFFDAQDWYIPVHADIRSDFTDIEKANIKLLLTYEKNAAEYYDSFGRG